MHNLHPERAIDTPTRIRWKRKSKDPLGQPCASPIATHNRTRALLYAGRADWTLLTPNSR